MSLVIKTQAISSESALLPRNKLCRPIEKTALIHQVLSVFHTFHFLAHF